MFCMKQFVVISNSLDFTKHPCYRRHFITTDIGNIHNLDVSLSHTKHQSRRCLTFTVIKSLIYSSSQMSLWYFGLFNIALYTPWTVCKCPIPLNFNAILRPTSSKVVIDNSKSCRNLDRKSNSGFVEMYRYSVRYWWWMLHKKVDVMSLFQTLEYIC